MSDDSLPRENRIMIENIGREITEIKQGIRNLNERVTDLFNHQSNRLPLWATLFITLLSSTVVGLLVFALK
jgi:hypothetical protein